jgi:hypothetical protein
MGKPKRPRTTRRELVRRLGKAADAAERLFSAAPGGSPEHPLEVHSPSVIESRARGIACPRCGGEHDVLEHAAVTVAGARLREARLVCRACGNRRSIYFRLPVLN